MTLDANDTSERLEACTKATEQAFEAKDWKNVVKFAREGRRLQPISHWFCDRLGYALMELGKYSDAQRAFDAGFERVPDCPLLLLHQADLYFESGKEREGLAALRRFLKRDLPSWQRHKCSESNRWMKSRYLNALANAGFASLRLGEVKRATRYLEQHLSLRARGTSTMFTRQEVERVLQGSCIQRDKKHTKAPRE